MSSSPSTRRHDLHVSVHLLDLGLNSQLHARHARGSTPAIWLQQCSVEHVGLDCYLMSAKMVEQLRCLTQLTQSGEACHNLTKQEFPAAWNKAKFRAVKLQALQQAYNLCSSIARSKAESLAIARRWSFPCDPRPSHFVLLPGSCCRSRGQLASASKLADSCASLQRLEPCGQSQIVPDIRETRLLSPTELAENEDLPASRGIPPAGCADVNTWACGHHQPPHHPSETRQVHSPSKKRYSQVLARRR